MSNHKPECDAKWGYDQDHCICQWIELAEQRIIKLLEPIRQRNQGKGYEEEIVADTLSEVMALIKGETK